MWTCNRSVQQQSYIETVESRGTRYRNAYSDTCLDMVDSNNLRNGSTVYLWPCHEGFAQHFVASPDSNLLFSLITASRNARMSLDYDINTAGDGGNVQMWQLPDDTRTQQQTWIRFPVDRGAHETWASTCECGNPKSESFKLMCFPSDAVEPGFRFGNLCATLCGNRPRISWSYSNQHENCTPTPNNQNF